MNLVVFNMSNLHDWEQGIVNRNYFVLKELLKQSFFEDVFFVDFLAVQSLKKQFGWRRTGQYARTLLQGQADKRRGLLHLTMTAEGHPFGKQTKRFHVYQGLGRLTSAKRDLDQISEWLDEHGVSPDNLVVWSYNAFLPEAMDLPARLRVFDAVDNWSLHASYQKESARLRANYQRIGERADVIFTVSEGLRSLFPLEKSHWVPNGVDAEEFSSIRHETPNDLKQIPKPIIGYIGTVQERLDFELLEHVCKQHADKSFVFIGPVWSGVKEKQVRLQQACPNAYFLGRRPYNQVPAYLQAMDVTMIPHRLDAFISSTNPMKMYDYLAAGKPVVTTPGAGTELFEQIMHITSTSQDFSRAIGRALQETGPEFALQRREAVKPHTWQARVENMVQLLQSKLD